MTRNIPLCLNLKGQKELEINKAIITLNQYTRRKKRTLHLLYHLNGNVRH